MHTIGYLCAAFTVFSWGITFVSTRALLSDFSSLEILFVRFFMAYLVLWLLAPRRLKLESWKEEGYFALAGLTGATIYQMLENMAIEYANASNVVSIIVSVSPMFTALVCQAFLKEKVLSWRFGAGFVIAMLGVAFVCFNGNISFQGDGGMPINPLGCLLAIAGAACWGFYGLSVGLMNGRNYPQLLALRRMFFYSLVFMIPFLAYGIIAAPPSGSDFSVNLTAADNIERFSDWKNWLNHLFLGVIASAVSFATWNYACKILGTVRVNLGMYISPVVTVVFAFLFLGERLSPMGILGSFLTIAGVVISDWKKS